MGSMGRQYAGIHISRVPAGHIQGLRPGLPWYVLGALPEMVQNARGPPNTALGATIGETPLNCGGTTSVGLTAANLVKQAGAHVLVTLWRDDRRDMLPLNGAGEVFINAGAPERRSSGSRTRRHDNAARLPPMCRLGRLGLNERMVGNASEFE